MRNLIVTEKDKMMNDLRCAMDYTMDNGYVNINYDSIADELLKRSWHHEEYQHNKRIKDIMHKYTIVYLMDENWTCNYHTEAANKQNAVDNFNTFVGLKKILNIIRLDEE